MHGHSLDRELVTPAEHGSILYDALSQDKLELILYPTEKCNFRCVYCYEDFALGRMSRKVINGIKALIEARSNGLKTLHLAWFGGEPLLAFDIMEELSEFGQSMGNLNGYQQVMSITTNGSRLTREKIVKLAGWGTERLQVSLDGDAEKHDTTRLSLKGPGTFSTIWENLQTFEACYREGLTAKSHVILRLHLSPDNGPSLLRLAEMINSSLSPGAFSINVQVVGHWGGSQDASFAVLEEAGELARSRAAELYRVLDRFEPEIDENAYVCYAGKANSFAIRSDGTINKCTVALKSKANQIGTILEDGTLDLEAEKLGPWFHALSSMDKGDLACPIARLPKELLIETLAAA